MTETRARLELVPMDLASAQEFVRRHHRHHPPPVGHKFSLGCVDDKGELRGVAVIGRPVARRLDDGWTLEVARVAVDGCPNACSFLYSAAWRAVRDLGFRRLVTYTLPAESGASLRGAGWKIVGETPGRSWSCPSRPRASRNLGLKLRWEPSP